MVPPFLFRRSEKRERNPGRALSRMTSNEFTSNEFGGRITHNEPHESDCVRKKSLERVFIVRASIRNDPEKSDRASGQSPGICSGPICGGSHFWRIRKMHERPEFR